MSLTFIKKTRLLQGESNCMYGLKTLGAGVYLVKIDLVGNALLSTLFVEAIDAGSSIEVEYFDFTTGGDLGEETALRSHPIQTAIGTHRQTVTNVHNKPVARIKIVGGNVTFSLYGTSVGTTLSESDANLYFNEENFNQLLDKSRGIAGLDRINNRWLAVGVNPDGSLKASFELGEQPDTLFERFDGVTTPAIEQTIISYSVPVSKKLYLTRLNISTRQSGTYRIYVGSVKIGGGSLNPTHTNDSFLWTPPLNILAGGLVTVKFETYVGRPVSKLDAYLMGYHKPI